MRKHKRVWYGLLFVLIALAGTVWRQTRQVHLDKGLFTAIKARKPQDVGMWLDRGANPNAKDTLEYSLTAWQLLQQRFRSLWDRRERGQEPLVTPLYPAVYVDDDANYPITEEFIAAERVDPETREAMVRTLLEHGAQVDEGYGGKTPLLEALRNGYTRSAELLLEHGANVKAKNEHNKTALMDCICTQRRLIKRLVDAETDINARDDRGYTALHYACQNDNAELASQLLAKGADTNVKAKQGETAWKLASTYGHAELIRLFLDRGVDVNWRDVNGIPLLLQAAKPQDKPLIELLISRGAKVNVTDPDGDTPLMEVCGYGMVKSARLLIEHGANVNARMKDGETALVQAVRRDQDKTCLQNVRLLLAHHARIDVRDRHGRSLLQIARSNPSSTTPEIIRLLKRAGAKDAIPTTKAASDKNSQ